MNRCKKYFERPAKVELAQLFTRDIFSIVDGMQMTEYYKAHTVVATTQHSKVPHGEVEGREREGALLWYFYILEVTSTPPQ